MIATVPGRTGWKRRALELSPVVVGAGLLAWRAIATVIARTGHPGAALDDAYIHFQYARAIAEGHPLRYQAGAPFTSGATSALWPALLAPFWALGARDDAILWPAWALSFTALGALAWEASRWTQPLAGRVAAAGAAALTLAFAGFAWSAASGMEVVPFAWAIARASRRASDWAEAPPAERTAKRAAELIAMAWVAALFRPEGAVTAVFVAATLAAFTRTGAAAERARSIAALAAALALPALLWVLTGSPRSSTAVVKLLPGNPYYPGGRLFEAVWANARLLVGTLLDGEVWSAEFLPHRGAVFALLGLGAVAVRGALARRPWRAASVLLVALMMFAPCFYSTFLWNRLRYLWPFTTGWLVGLACLARVAGDAAGMARARWRTVVTGLACGGAAGMLASHLEWSIDDVGQSASGIDRQQVALGRWARAALPASAVVGVNDTGAIAYFGERRTFDIVGLTTRDEAPYWVAGAASRFEHYERLLARDPASLPTHLIVYPQWMAMDFLFGPALEQATVLDATILGGPTMVAYVADWSRLGSGERPWTQAGAILDAVDVADLQSEEEHAYELLGAHDGEQVVRDGLSPAGDEVVDGGRTMRLRERFTVRVPPSGARGILRFEALPKTSVRVTVDGRPAGTLDAGDDGWVERGFDVPASAATAARAAAGGARRIEVTSDAPINTYHYWFSAR
jgi:hypothetical protein